MRVALVHDWLTGLRGGEKVLESLIELFPEATLFTLLHIPDATSPRIESVPIRTAYIQHLPFVKNHYRWYLPLFPSAIESLHLEGFDLVLSSSHCVAKGIRPPAGALHVCYCHTPMRYVWDRFEDYFGKGLKARLVYGPIAARLRRWDVTSADRVHQFIANSSYVAERIQRYYGREVDAVIPAPVDTEFFTPADKAASEPYYLVVSALVPYKRIDVAIETFRRRPERLIVVGSGPSERYLKARAGPNVEFRGFVSDAELRQLYRGCRALLLPGVEDFGIVPLEAQACGRPVVALGQGGVLDTVRDRVTGVLYDEPTPSALSSAIDKASSLSFNKEALRDWATGFSREKFRSRVQEFIRARVEQADR